MVNRRTTLLAMVGAGLTASAVARALETEPNAAAPATPAAPDRALQEDLAKLGSHEYSDEGIAVFLACVDLVAEQAGSPASPAPEFSKHVAADLRRYGDAWLRMHPDAPDTDAGKIIEVLADRDFKTGTKGGGA
jgi:hypothetical protein